MLSYSILIIFNVRNVLQITDDHILEAIMLEQFRSYGGREDDYPQNQLTYKLRNISQLD